MYIKTLPGTIDSIQTTPTPAIRHAPKAVQSIAHKTAYYLRTHFNITVTPLASSSNAPSAFSEKRASSKITHFSL